MCPTSHGERAAAAVQRAARHEGVTAMGERMRSLVERLELRGRAAAIADAVAAGEDGPPRVLSERAAAYLAFSPAARDDAIGELSQLIAAAHAELLDLVAAAAVAGDHEADGATDMAAALVARCRVSTPTAREWTRVADALQSLPALRQAYAEGLLSWDQVRPASWFVTPAVDSEAAELLPSLSASQISRLARRCRPRTPADAASAHANRHLEIRPDHRCGGFRYRGFLPTDLGAELNAVLMARAESMGKDPETGAWAPLPVRLADALNDLAADPRGDAPVDPDATCVVIHVDAAPHAGPAAAPAPPDRTEPTPAAPPPTPDAPPSADATPPAAAAEALSGTIGDLALHADGVLRALCDCRVEVALHGPDGRTVGIGRAGRTVPWWLRRVVAHRDRTCRFPGCERRIRQHHHIRHWTAHGGPTNADNLVGVCWHHHHLVHEGGWTIEGHPDLELTFVGPDGRRWSSRPQPIGPAARRLLGDLSPPDGPT